jgi:glutamate dehydrogenase/leucine dehydrogenase
MGAPACVMWRKTTVAGIPSDVSPDELLQTDVDVFIPAALDGMLRDADVNGRTVRSGAAIDEQMRASPR